MNRIRGVLVVVGLLSSLRDASPINIVRKVTHWLAITFAGEKCIQNPDCEANISLPIFNVFRRQRYPFDSRDTSLQVEKTHALLRQQMFKTVTTVVPCRAMRSSPNERQNATLDTHFSTFHPQPCRTIDGQAGASSKKVIRLMEMINVFLHCRSVKMST